MKAHIEKVIIEDFDKEKAKTDFVYFATHCLIDARTGKPFQWSRAQIEQLKKIAELKENEDEKIRKDILAYLKGEFGDGEKQLTPYTHEIPKWYAWLKKQDARTIKEALRTEYEKGRADAIAEFEKQSEQKPIEWNADDLLKRNQIMDILQEYNRTELIAWFEKQGEQNPAWSEEDEKHYKGCLTLMKLSLDTKPYPYYNDYLWLKSIKPQPHWQPSEEQMEALRVASEVGTANESWAMEKLKTLYSDLQKL